MSGSASQHGYRSRAWCTFCPDGTGALVHVANGAPNGTRTETQAVMGCLKCGREFVLTVTLSCASPAPSKSRAQALQRQNVTPTE